MKIASSLLNWLQGPQAQQVSSASVSQKAPSPSSEKAPATTSAQNADSVHFSDLAQKLSETNRNNPDAQISYEERQALREEFEPKTYKPSLMQMAKRLFGYRVF